MQAVSTRKYEIVSEYQKCAVFQKIRAFIIRTSNMSFVFMDMKQKYQLNFTDINVIGTSSYDQTIHLVQFCGIIFELAEPF